PVGIVGSGIRSASRQRILSWYTAGRIDTRRGSDAVVCAGNVILLLLFQLDQSSGLAFHRRRTEQPACEDPQQQGGAVFHIRYPGAVMQPDQSLGMSKLSSLICGLNRNSSCCNDWFSVGRNDCAKISRIVRALIADSDADA